MPGEQVTRFLMAPIGKTRDDGKVEFLLAVELFAGEFNKPVRKATEEDKQKHSVLYDEFKKARKEKGLPEDVPADAPVVVEKRGLEEYRGDKKTPGDSKPGALIEPGAGAAVVGEVGSEAFQQQAKDAQGNVLDPNAIDPALVDPALVDEEHIEEEYEDEHGKKQKRKVKKGKK
jgi:hypothetical protein